MSATIRIAGFEATIDDSLEWSLVVTPTAVDALLVRTVLGLLTRHYGASWIPVFGVYEPNMANAAARAVVEDFGAELLESRLDPFVGAIPGAY